MREAPLRNPTKIRRVKASIICKLPATMIAHSPKTNSNNPSILICHQHLRGKVNDSLELHKRLSGIWSHKKCMYIFKIINNLFFFLGIYNEECYVDQLKDSTDRIDSHNHHIVIRYKGCAIPHAEQAIQKSIYIWQPWELFCWLVSENSPKSGSENLKGEKSKETG